MKKPSSLLYGVDDNPPLHVTILNGAQHVGLIAINLVYPLLIFRAVDTPVPVVSQLLAVAMLVLAVGTFLQVARIGPLGSGYMCPATFTASYLAPSLLAAKTGGLPLVFGMTIFAGVLEVVIAPVLNRLRAIFPPEVSGLVIFMIGIAAGIAGLRSMLGTYAVAVGADEWWVAGLTLATMVALNVWAKGIVRMLCTLIGLIAGYAASLATGIMPAEELVTVAQASWVGLPRFDSVSWDFDVSAAVPFAVATLAVAMKAMGTITVCQRTNDATWVRPDMASVTRGVLTDGVSTAMSGIAGGVGTNTSTPSVGLAAATGVASRSVAYAAAAIFLGLAFLPKLAAVLAVMPRPVVVAALLFTVSFIVINGLQVMTSRMLDARRTIVIGISILAGVAVEVFPVIAATAPPWIAPMVGSSLVFSTIIALSLNLVFRIGVRRVLTISLQPSDWKSEQVEEQLTRQGAVWGARPDAMNDASWAICQVLEAVADNCWNTGTLTIDVTYDEFNLDVRMRYSGEVLEFPSQRPTQDEILASDDGVRRLAGYMLRHIADRVHSESQQGSAVLRFHFDH